jgi:ATP-binding cassette subfamily B protein
MAALLARLYDPTEGSISVDGIDLRDVDVPSLRHQIAYVSDDNFLFSDTIAENISYAKPDATREDVEKAARLAQAAEFIDELPEGYETVVGERGLTLSGGQRQRVAIARALLADPRILILDDATSSLDATTEQKIRSGLAEVMAGRTTFVIGHRLSTISLADEVLLMEEGQIRDRGTVDELTERSPLFRELTGGSGEDPLFVPEDEEVLA